MKELIQELALLNADACGAEAAAWDRVMALVNGEDVIERRNAEDAAGSQMVDADCDGME